MTTQRAGRRTGELSWLFLVNQSADREYNDGKPALTRPFNRRGFQGDRGICSVVLSVCRIMGSIDAWNDMIVILLLALIGALPRWPHSRSLGYCPSGGVGLVLLIIVILLVLDRI